MINTRRLWSVPPLLSALAVPPGTPQGLRLAWGTFTSWALPLWGLDIAGIWVMPLGALVVISAAAVTVSFSASVCWVSALGYHRDKLALVDFAAHLLAAPESPDDPSHRHLRRAG